MPYIYLASPYSHPDAGVVVDRVRSALNATRELLCTGVPVYSPIVHCHELATTGGLPTDHEFWMNYNHQMLISSSALLVLKLPDWERSHGVMDECQFARRHFIPTVMAQEDILGEYVEELNDYLQLRR